MYSVPKLLLLDILCIFLFVQVSWLEEIILLQFIASPFCLDDLRYDRMCVIFYILPLLFSIKHAAYDKWIKKLLGLTIHNYLIWSTVVSTIDYSMKLRG